MDFSAPTPETLAQIKDLASAFTPIDEIAAILDCDSDDLRDAIFDSNGSVRRAYYLGKSESALAIRRAEINMASAGSPMAIQHANEYLARMSNSEIN